MPLYMFHLRSGKSFYTDDTGVEFASLELAYLDAFRAAGEIWLEMARQGEDGSGHSFEITDSMGHLLMEVPFTEVFQNGPQSLPSRPRAVGIREATQATAKSQSLIAEIATLVTTAQQTVRHTRRVLGRARPDVL